MRERMMVPATSKKPGLVFFLSLRFMEEGLRHASSFGAAASSLGARSRMHNHTIVAPGLRCRPMHNVRDRV